MMVMDKEERMNTLIERGIQAGDANVQKEKWERAGWNYYKSFLLLESFKYSYPDLVLKERGEELSRKLHDVGIHTSQLVDRSRDRDKKNLFKMDEAKRNAAEAESRENWKDAIKYTVEAQWMAEKTLNFLDAIQSMKKHLQLIERNVKRQ